ncbi:ankyrin repeat domain-containing protein [Desulfosarcina variabilis]|uniref:ankyrin repeat domain-containing protein n=1 Tax=Desulfosarcina variabilis TaxID=2300 RepID=UPI003AFA4C3B
MAPTTPTLIAAISSNNTEQAKNLIEKNYDLNTFDENGNAALHHTAAKKCSIEITKKLIANGADVNIKNLKGLSPLSIAIKSHNTETFSWLIENGADINSVDYQGHTPIFYAAYSGFSDMVAQLINNGADVNAAAKDGRTPLHAAAIGEQVDCLKLCLQAGAIPRQSDKSEEAILATAMLYKLTADYHLENSNIKKAKEELNVSVCFFENASSLFADRASSIKTKLFVGYALSGICLFLSATSASLQATTNMVPTPSGNLVGIGTSAVYLPDSSNTSKNWNASDFYNLLSTNSEKKLNECRNLQLCLNQLSLNEDPKQCLN